MGKKDGVISGVLNNISEEFLDKKIDKIIAVTKEIADNQAKINEKKYQAEQKLDEMKFRAKQEFCREEKEAVKEEFNRICGMLKKTDPTTDKYEKLSDALYNIKKLLTGWDGYSYD